MARITLTTTPQRIDSVGTDNIAGTVHLYRCDTAIVHLGRNAAEATPANSYPLPAGDPFSDEILGRDQLWASVDTGTATLYVLPAGI